MDWSKPVKVSEVDSAFPAQVTGKFLPPREDVPEEFQDWDNKWNELASKWMFEGGKIPPVKEGLSEVDAIRQIKACLGSFEPNHEDKIAGVAYLASMFFEDLDEIKN